MPVRHHSPRLRHAGEPNGHHPISVDAKTHYHKKLTEIYLILEGEGHMELDGELIPVRPLTTIFIPPGVRHRAIGKMKIVNVPIPAFDPHDEWYD